MTDWNLPRTGFMARLASRQASCRAGQRGLMFPKVVGLGNTPERRAAVARLASRHAIMILFNN